MAMLPELLLGSVLILAGGTLRYLWIDQQKMKRAIAEKQADRDEKFRDYTALMTWRSRRHVFLGNPNVEECRYRNFSEVTPEGRRIPPSIQSSIRFHSTSQGDGTIGRLSRRRNAESSIDEASALGFRYRTRWRS